MSEQNKKISVVWYMLRSAVSLLKSHGVIFVCREVISQLKKKWKLVFGQNPFTKKDVVFFSGCPGAPMRYRCTNMKEAWELAGKKADVFEYDEVQMVESLAYYDIFFLHRVPYTDMVAKCIEEGKKLGKIFVFDTDDLIFEPKFAKYLKIGATQNEGELKRLEDLFSLYKQTLLACDSATCSTEKLYVELVSMKGEGRVKKVENFVSQELIKLSETALADKHEYSGKVVLGYFSGSHTHDEDFATIESELRNLLLELPEVRLLIMGPLSSSLFTEFPDRVEKVGYREWRHVPSVLARVDVNLIPLKATPFAEGKSDLKYFEAALVKVPSCAMNYGEFQSHMVSEEDGILCTTPQDWFSQLSTLMRDSAKRKQLGEHAYRKILTSRTSKSVAVYLKQAIWPFLQKK